MERAQFFTGPTTFSRSPFPQEPVFQQALPLPGKANLGSPRLPVSPELRPLPHRGPYRHITPLSGVGPSLPSRRGTNIRTGPGSGPTVPTRPETKQAGGTGPPLTRPQKLGQANPRAQPLPNPAGAPRETPVTREPPGSQEPKPAVFTVPHEPKLEAQTHNPRAPRPQRPPRPKPNPIRPTHEAPSEPTAKAQGLKGALENPAPTTTQSPQRGLTDAPET